MILLVQTVISDYCLSQSSFFNVIEFGAKNDGKTLNTKAIQATINACAVSGGGTVYFPAGRYLSGTIYLKSHVELHLVSGAVLEGSKDLKDYPVTTTNVRSYTDNYTNKSIIYAEDLENISITGKGTIDGNGAFFKTESMINDDRIRKKDDWAHYKLRPFMIRMINCRNILVRDVKIINSPMWVQHYLSCEDVNIEGITVISHVNLNNDGIDIDGCENVRISDCMISSGDDAIVLKSTLDRPCKNVVVSNCILRSDCNAFKLGTETNGGFQNITLSNCTISKTRLAGIALQMVDGGALDGVNVSNVIMDEVGTAIFIRLGNRARPFEEKKPVIGIGELSNVIISNIQAKNTGMTGCSITGLPGFPVKNITLNNIRIYFKGGGTADLKNREIQELPDAYPEYNMFGLLPAYGFFTRHAENIKFNNVELGFDQPESRPAMIFDDVTDLELSGIKARTDGSSPVLWFKRLNNSFIYSCKAYENTNSFLQLSGEKSTNVTLMGNDLGHTVNPVINENGSSVFIGNNRMPVGLMKLDDKRIDCDPQIIDDRHIRINDPEDVLSKRLEIINAIWGTTSIPDRKHVLVSKGVASPLNPGSYIASVDKIEIPLDPHVLRDNVPVLDLAYHFIPKKRNNRLVIFNPGHLCTVKENLESENNYGTEATITGLLKQGFDVLAVYMPHVSETDCNLDHCSIINTPLGIANPTATYGLRFFLDPTIVSLNYLLEENTYQDVSMIGLSGGGWTTNMIAAIDDRIKYSFSIAGSMPLYYRYAGSVGDVEQYLPQFYRDIAGYPDLYILGSFGNGRKQIQVLNRYDNCCFGQNQHDPGRDYETDLKAFEKSVKDRLIMLGAEDHYYLWIDESAPSHQISTETLEKIISKELK